MILTSFWHSCATIWNSLLFTDMNPLVKKGCAKQLDEKSADVYHKSSFDSEFLSDQLDMKMKEITQRMNDQGKEKTNILRSAVWSLHYKRAIIVIFMTLFLSFIRFGSALVFEQLLQWFEDEDAPSHEGWIWGALYASSSIIGNLTSTHMFYISSMIGLKIKLALLGLTHKKILKLNTAIISWQTTGQIVNFASNDLKFFEDGVYILPYMISGPVDLIGSFILFGTRIGWLASFLGLFVMIFFMPIQGALMGKVKKFKQKALMVADGRISATSEMITGILAVKSFTWEKSIFSKIKNLRLKEQKQLIKIATITALTSGVYNFVSGFIPFATFTTVILSGQSFTVSSAFFILAILNISRISVTILFPLSIAMLAQMTVSLRRLNSFLNLKEPPLLKRLDGGDEGEKIMEPRGTIDARIEDFGWLVRIKEKEVSKTSDSKKPLLSRRLSSKDMSSSKKEKFMTKEEKKLKELKSVKSLHNISFKIAPGELIGIIGEVGSGKSSLLSALLGEMQDLTGDNDITFFSNNKTKLRHKQMYGSISYCAQSPWILSGTVKENILFGSPFDEDWYNHVIKSCSLEPDLEQFSAGDMTELGERGINLSGGQKARISLARAAYKKADINLLDDPLSAVDPKVANTLFDLCISNDGILHNKTRLLVSHQVQFMNRCDRVFIMDTGRIIAMGTYDELMQSEHSQVFKRLEKTSESDSGEFDASEKEKASSSNSLDEVNNYNEESTVIQLEKEKAQEKTSNDGKLVDTEKKETGSVSWRVYWSLLKYFGFLKFFIIIVPLILYTSLTFFSQFWIYEWAFQEPSDQDDGIWILGLGIICLLLFVLSMSYSVMAQGFTLISFTKIHFDMLKSVISAPLSFFHTNPSGRIINRFSKDQSMSDTILVMALNDVLQIFILTLAIILVVCIALPYITVLFPFFLYLVCKLSDMYLKSSREVRRFDGITRSPIYEQISENLKGLATIRAYGMEDKFNKTFIPVLNRNGTWWMCYQRLIRWFGIRLDLMGSVVLIVSTFLSIGLKEHVSTELVSVAFLNIMMMVFILQYAVRQYGTVENGMTGVERMLEYTRLEKEPLTVEEGADPGPEGWPSKGVIICHNVTSRYRSELKPVLHNLTFEIPAGISVGIIGRTGSGKSSFLLTLYRLIEKIEGKIYLDGIDIESIGLDVLRRNLAIIPQDPILFEGSLRFNLDPWNQFSDEKLWEILNTVRLKEVISECGGLDAQLSEGGNNFSVGQRQLLCLARALLKDAKVLSVDEATANVDNQTDGLVQSAIRQFVSEKNENGERYRTIFVIAHRLDTILDCDMLMVFDNGNIIEMGSPAELKMKTDGVFSSMLKASNNLTVNN